MQLVRTLALFVAVCGLVAAQEQSPAPPASTTAAPTAETPGPTPPTPTPTSTPDATTATPTAPPTTIAAPNTAESASSGAVATATVEGEFTNVELSAKQDNIEVSISSTDITVKSVGAVPFSGPVAKQMRVLPSSSTNLLKLQSLSSEAITRLEIASYDATRHTKLSISSFTLLSSLSSLSFSNVNFYKSKVTLAAPASLSYLQISKTNAEDVGVTTETIVNEIDFSENNFSALPYLLYQRRYPEPLKLLSNLTFASDVTQLSPDEFANALHNLGSATGTAMFTFAAACDVLPTTTTVDNLSANHILCNDSSRAGIRLFGNTESNIIVDPEAPTPTPTPRDSSSNTTLTVIVIVIAVIAAVLAYFVARRYFCTSASTSRSPRLNERTVGLISKEDPQAAHNKLSFISSDDALRQVRLEQQDVSVTKSLGTGQLWIGDYAGRKVMIKRIEAESNDSYATKGLITQARALASVSHPNIVSLIGVTWVQGTDFGVVSEFMEKGTLRAVLMDLDSELDLQSKLHMCIDIAQALMYLHSSEQNLYMKRLTSRKVLVNGAIECKLTLFECHPCTNRIEYPEVFGAGQMAWEAPELITRTGVLDPRKINIFALGVLIGEIITRVSPYQSAVDAVGHTLADLELSKRIRRQERLMPHENRREFTELPAILRDMVDRCLSYQPLLRPTAEEVVHCLESVKDYSERVGSTTSL